MGLGYLKTFEAVLAVILVVFALIPTTFNASYSSEWDYTILQQTGQDAFLVLKYTDKIRNFVYDANYSGMNSSIYALVPNYVSFNVKINDTTVINNGNPEDPVSVFYFLAGKTDYNPKKVEMVLWYK
ncbi:hypothetical protein H0N95_01250 [Candidatus Micrarchaeota archaeon]|nr:hypothetical protein [Candidatus Micrarchaeota archaeon]